MRQAIVPDALKDAALATGFSRAIRAGGFLFLTGATGGRPDGTMPQTAHDQVHIALGKVAEILATAGNTEADVVEATSYHTDIKLPFIDVQTTLEEVVLTAVEVAGLRRHGACVDFRILARDPQAGTA